MLSLLLHNSSTTSTPLINSSLWLQQLIHRHTTSLLLFATTNNPSLTHSHTTFKILLNITPRSIQTNVTVHHKHNFTSTNSSLSNKSNLNWFRGETCKTNRTIRGRKSRCSEILVVGTLPDVISFTSILIWKPIWIGLGGGIQKLERQWRGES